MAYRSGSRPGLVIPLTSTVGLMTAFGSALLEVLYALKAVEVDDRVRH